MSGSLQQRRATISILFFIPGVGFASWITRTPAIRDLIHATTAQFGIALLALSLGSILGTLSSGPAVNRFGTRPVIIIGQLINASGVGAIGLLSATGQIPLTGLALAMIGLGMGFQQIAINVEGAEVERLVQRSVMPSLHGFFSSGTVLGALIGMGMSALAVPVYVHLPVVAALMICASLVVTRGVPAGVGRGTRQPTAAADRTAIRTPVWQDPRLLLICALIFSLCMSEGTANDWLPLVMVDGHGMNPTWSSAIFAVFAIAMTTGRFIGGRLVDRFGNATVLGGSAALAGIGLALVIFVDQQVIAGAGVLMWGLGASLGFPIALSSAAESGPHPAARVSLAATIGSLASLAGPPLLGHFGQAWGLRHALILVLAMLVIAVALSPVARPRTGRAALCSCGGSETLAAAVVVPNDPTVVATCASCGLPTAAAPTTVSTAVTVAADRPGAA